MGILGIYVRTSIDKDNTSIEQQKSLGISFSKKNKFEYQVYEDVGKSGYKIEDEENPFKDRHGLIKLIEDIEKKIVDKIWVFEHSRLSRNQYSSYILNRIFQKHNITIYENDKRFDMDKATAIASSSVFFFVEIPARNFPSAFLKDTRKYGRSALL